MLITSVGIKGLSARSLCRATWQSVDPDGLFSGVGALASLPDSEAHVDQEAELSSAIVSLQN